MSVSSPGLRTILLTAWISFCVENLGTLTVGGVVKNYDIIPSSTSPPKAKLNLETCNRTEKAKRICKILLRSKKFLLREASFLQPMGELKLTTKSTDEGWDQKSFYASFSSKSKLFRSNVHTSRKRKRQPSWWRQILRLRRNLADLPFSKAALPYIWTLAIAILLRFYIEREYFRGGDDETPSEPSLVPMEPPVGKVERLELAKEVVAVTGESLDLSNSKLYLDRVLAKLFFPNGVMQEPLNLQLVPHSNSTVISDVSEKTSKSGIPLLDEIIKLSLERMQTSMPTMSITINNHKA